ncbi:MAG: immunoglobulin domain-containing protein [Rubrivivax sp.]
MAALCALSLAACGGGEDAPAVNTPTITAAPVDQTVTAGSPATFTVAATGTGPLSYQWQRNGSAIEGATSTSYSLAAPDLADSGASFRVAVTNVAGSVTSVAATLTVNPLVAATIVTQPTDATVVAGSPASFSVLAGGSSPLNYQWQRDGTDIAGANAATYTLANPTAADSGAAFGVVVGNAAGNVTSNNALLTVADSVTAPVITAQPQSSATLDGATASFVVAARGTAPFSYQWRKNGTAIPGAASSSYTTPTLTLADGGNVYTVVVSNGAGSATSSNATLTINPRPVAVTAQPVGATVVVGATAGFSVTATGSVPITYQWRKNGAAISGANGASYTTPATVSGDNGALLSVVIGNAAGSVTSANATLTVTSTSTAPTISTAPTSLTVLEGQDARFSVTASGSGTLNYQWRRNGANIAGATGSAYTLAAAALADNGSAYSVIVSNAVGSVTSSSVVLTVQAAIGVLTGRKWEGGQPLEENTSATSVLRRDYVIDDAGRVTMVFQKSDGTRDVLYATRGTPNAAGTAPTWSTPVPIDLLGATPVSSMGSSTELTLMATPGGDVVALWFHNAVCAAGTYQTSSTCRYYYYARYRIASNTWDAPALLTDAPNPDFQVRINDRGDLAFFGKGWIRSGTSSYQSALTLYMRSGGDTAVRKQSLGGEPIDAWEFAMDNSGNLLLATQNQQNATVDIVAYRGTVAAGLGMPQVLDTRGAAATLDVARIGLNGQQIVVWTQNNGVKTTTYAAASPTPTGPFTVTDLDFVGSQTSFRVLAISDEGRAMLYSIGNSTRREWTAAGGWTAAVAMASGLPANQTSYTYGVTRNGDMLIAQTIGCCSDGGTATYDAKRNVMITTEPKSSPASGYVLGFSRSGMGYGGVVLSNGGIGFTDMLAKYDTLPTPTAPAGDGRDVANLWGAFLK